MNSFIIANPKKCIGCRTCEVACVMAHSKDNLLISTNQKMIFNPKLSVIKTATVSAPIQCRHCEDAPCANSCPTDAIINKNGIVYIDENLCIGCKTCAIVCPFGAIDITETNQADIEKTVVANKCDLCVGRENGPACIEVCPTKALELIQKEDIQKSTEDKRSKAALELMFF